MFILTIILSNNLKLINMKKTKLFLSLLFVGAIFMSSCEGEESSTTSGNCSGLESLAVTLNQKSEAFNANPNSSNCSAMRTAALNLIEAAQDCDGATAEQYEAAAQAWLDIDCSAFD
jgi:hypothetical protein